ncbi:MAG: hypothetical protein FWG90_12535 [Oscillospiraceae bacterium]|nr:hypothetical protein [Oscillospiraceae bacterium]
MFGLGLSDVKDSKKDKKNKKRDKVEDTSAFDNNVFNAAARMKEEAAKTKRYEQPKNDFPDAVSDDFMRGLHKRSANSTKGTEYELGVKKVSKNIDNVDIMGMDIIPTSGFAQSKPQLLAPEPPAKPQEREEPAAAYAQPEVGEELEVPGVPKLSRPEGFVERRKSNDNPNPEEGFIERRRSYTPSVEPTQDSSDFIERRRAVDNPEPSEGFVERRRVYAPPATSSQESAAAQETATGFTDRRKAADNPTPEEGFVERRRMYIPNAALKQEAAGLGSTPAPKPPADKPAAKPTAKSETVYSKKPKPALSEAKEAREADTSRTISISAPKSAAPRLILSPAQKPAEKRAEIFVPKPAPKPAPKQVAYEEPFEVAEVKAEVKKDTAPASKYKEAKASDGGLKNYSYERMANMYKKAPKKDSAPVAEVKLPKPKPLKEVEKIKPEPALEIKAPIPAPAAPAQPVPPAPKVKEEKLEAAPAPAPASKYKEAKASDGGLRNYSYERMVNMYKKEPEKKAESAPAPKLEEMLKPAPPMKLSYDEPAAEQPSAAVDSDFYDMGLLGDDTPRSKPKEYDFAKKAAQLAEEGNEDKANFFNTVKRKLDSKDEGTGDADEADSYTADYNQDFYSYPTEESATDFEDGEYSRGYTNFSSFIDEINFSS